jgi:hypothetical protein
LDDEAPRVLEVFGYAYDQDEGVWRRRGDAAANLLRTLLDEAYAIPEAEYSTEAQGRFRQRVETLLRTGSAPPLREDVDDQTWTDYAYGEGGSRFKQGVLVGAGVMLAGTMAGWLFGRKR